MSRFPLLCAAVLIVELCRGSLAVKPRLTPNDEYISIREGDELRISCTDGEDLAFQYPNGEENSDAKVFRDDDGNLVLLRESTIRRDNGWYGCAERSASIGEPGYDDPDVAWTYVYVTSEQNAFVTDETFQFLSGISGATLVIPCRATSPDLNVVLVGMDEIPIEMGDKFSYDPKVGFTVKSVTVKDSGQFKCIADIGNATDEVIYHVMIAKQTTRARPIIEGAAVRHVVRGQDMRVNCTTDVDIGISYVFNWTTPLTDNRVSTRHYVVKSSMNRRKIVVELTVRRVTDADAGRYSCYIQTTWYNESATKDINVYDPDFKYINLSLQDHSDPYYELEEEAFVQWVVYVDAFPKPKLQWLDKEGKDIIGSWEEPSKPKFAVNISSTSTILRINRLKVEDSGVYSLQANNGDELKTLNFSLTVKGKPVPFIRNVESYYPPNKDAELQCDVIAYPEPDVTWTFERYPNYPSLEHVSIVQLDNVSTTRMNYVYSVSIVQATIEVSGRLICKACNSLGCASATETVLVSDGNGAFGIIEPTEDVTEGDDFTLICAASIYNYTDDIDWLTGEIRINETERLKISQEKTNFTYRSSLRITDVRDSDSTTYTCRARRVDGLEEYSDYNLEVHAASAPFFIRTNMNESKATVDLSTDEYKTMVFKCFVGGMPRPEITWYKDGKEIKKTGQYIFLYRNQELRIQRFVFENDGEYTCHAKNRIGEIKLSRYLVVEGNKIPMIWIIVIVIAFVILLALIIYFSVKMRREKIMRKQLMEAGLIHFDEGAMECLNPELTVDDQAELLPYDKKWEFPQERLKFGKQLGSGAFGVVMRAEADGIVEDGVVTTVAVKMVRKNTEPTYIRALTSELKIMVHLGKHLNVVNLLGACTKKVSKRELLVIVEYCRFGNLHNYLLRHRGDFIDQIDPTTGQIDCNIGADLLNRSLSVGSNNSKMKYALLSFSRRVSVNSTGDSNDSETADYPRYADSQDVNLSPDGCVLSNNSTQPGWRTNYRGDYKDHNLKPICTQDLLVWAFQVARGMEYLSQRKVLHGDLAARNILLAEDNVVKICDFGLAKKMYKDDNYKKKGNTPLPIKWMAIESIRDKVFSTQSDVWSFGIVLWEFFTLAKNPYPGMEAERQYQKLIEGYRLEQPEYATKEVYDVMLKCWKGKPLLRPTFTELAENIGSLLEKSVRMYYVDLNEPYMDMNTAFLGDGKNDYLTMMSAPDHTVLSSPVPEYINSPSLPSDDANYLSMSPSHATDESGIFSPRPFLEKNCFEFPSPAEKSRETSDGEDAIELDPMLSNEEDNYLKPIDVHQRRAEFARQRQLQNKAARGIPIERDSGYCNTPGNPFLLDHGQKEFDVHRSDEDSEIAKGGKSKASAPAIIRTPDNYVNMPKQKSDLFKEQSDGFSNPSYVMMANRDTTQTSV